MLFAERRESGESRFSPCRFVPVESRQASARSLMALLVLAGILSIRSWDKILLFCCSSAEGDKQLKGEPDARFSLYA